MPGAGTIAEWGNAASIVGLIGLVISVLGLVYSFLAWRAAKSATAAANEAKQAAYQENAADELSRMAQGARPLFDLVKNGRLDRASLIMEELMLDLSQFRTHWKLFISIESESALHGIQENIEIQLGNHNAWQTDIGKLKLMEGCKTISIQLHEESGKMRSKQGD